MENLPDLTSHPTRKSFHQSEIINEESKLDRAQILAQIQLLKPGKKIRFGKVSIIHNRIKCNYLIMLEGNYIEETIDLEVTVNWIIDLGRD